MNAAGQARHSSEETYLSYVSPLVLRSAPATADTALPIVERAAGAVALIDVERFSAFAERMARRGGEGIEHLATRINDTFATVVDAIERHGGIAHGFPGDSVIALWLADGRTLEQSVLLASRCALELLDAHRDSELPLKAGLAVGDLHIAHVGGVDGRLHLLLSGEALDQMGRAEARSSRGRLFVADQAWRLLPPHAVAAVEADGFFEVKSLRAVPDSTMEPAQRASDNSRSIESVRAYLPAALLRQLDAGHSQWLGEFREVTTLFVEIQMPAGAEDDFTRIHEAFRQVQQAVYLHGGDITRFAHDDKGLIVLSVFGLPPASSEAVAARAVSAALEIERSAPVHRFGCRAGIASGNVFCGTLGAPRRREYSVVGSTANLAARLMQAARQGVLCDQATRTAAAAAHRFEGAGSLGLRGFGDSTEVFRPSAASASADPRLDVAPRTPSRLVGRDRERRRLQSWIEDVRFRLPSSIEPAALDGSPLRTGSLAVVQGEAGVGKSTLILDAFNCAREAGFEVACIACEAIHSSSTYATWAKVLVRLLDLDAIADANARAARVVAALDAAGVGEELSPLLAPILRVPIEENETTRDMSGSARGANLLAALARLVSSLAGGNCELGKPLLLILEDVHWLDPASWELLGVVTRAFDTNPLGVLLTMRSETIPSSSHWHGIVTAPEVERFSLGPLSPADTRELALHLLKAGDISKQLVTLTYERTRGNPFFCEQLLSELLESGIVGVESGVASLRIRNPEQAESLVPRSVAAVVTSRLDRLPAPVQLTLKAASVVGARFGLDVLRALHPMQLDDETLLAHLAGAVELGLVEADEVEAGAHRFRHAITCDVAYGLLLVSQRRQLHRDVAEYLSRDAAAPVAQAVLFYHWRRSGDEARALRHVDEAGAEAMRNGNYHSVVELYGYALATSTPHEYAAVAHSPRKARHEPPPREGPYGRPPRVAPYGKPPLAAQYESPPREALWSGHLGEAQVAIGLHDAARPNLEMCLETLGQSAPAHAPGLVAAVLGETLRQLLHRLFPQRFEGSRAAEAGRLALAADTYEQLGFVYYSAAEILRGFHAALRILNLSELTGDATLMARSYAVMSMSASVIGLHRLAALYDRRAMRVARETDNILAQAYVGWVTGLRAAGEARWSLVATRIEAARRLAEQSGDRRLTIMCLQGLAWPPYVRGDFVRAAEFAESQLAIARESNNRLWEAWGLNGLSESSLMAGDYDAVIRQCRRSLEVLAEESDRNEEIRAIGLLAVSLLRCNRKEDALVEARRGLEYVCKVELTNFVIYEGFVGVCEVLLTLAEEARTQSGAVPGALRRDLRRSVRALARFSRTFPIGRPRLHVTRARLAVLEGTPRLALREFDRAQRAADDLDMPYEKALTLIGAARCEALAPDARRRRAEEAAGMLGGGAALREAQAIVAEAAR